MKNIILIGVILFTLSFLSCKDYLKVDSPSAFNSSYVFSNANDAYKMLLGVYACFPTDPYTSRMSNVFMMNNDIEVAVPNAAPSGDRRDVWALQPSYTFNDIKSCWDMCYLAVDRANQCIEGIKASSLYASGNADMKQMLGEAYCLRAYWYFLLCNYWGDVPAAFEASKTGVNLNQPRADKDSIYSELIQNLIDTEEGMAFADNLKGGIGRMNREFALGMISRLSLFRAGYSMQYDGTMKRKDDYLKYYQIAKQYCQKLIALKDRPLNPDFRQIFLNQCQLISPVNDDILFEVAFVTGSGGDVGWCIGLSVASSSYGSGGSYIHFPTSYYTSFNPNDQRLPVTCGLAPYTTDTLQYLVNPTTIDPSKWCRLWLPAPGPGSASSKGTGIHWPLMRYSDILLMLAEAENELNGPTDIAKDALKRVRNRAFLAADRPAQVEDYVNAINTKDDFFNAIVNERAWEFGGEMLRKFDLVRWNLYGKKIIETKQALYSMGLAAYGVPGNEQYAGLADKLYYKLVKQSGIWKVVLFNNPFQMVPDPNVTYQTTEWSSMNWTKALAKSDLTQADYITYCWRGYTDATGQSAVPYLLPIGQATIIASNGVLSNDGYGLPK